MVRHDINNAKQRGPSERRPMFRHVRKYCSITAVVTAVEWKEMACKLETNQFKQLTTVLP